MRLPHNVDEGTFSLDCPTCQKELDIEIKKRNEGSESIKINGRHFHPKKATSFVIEPEKKVVIASEVSTVLDLPYKRRMRLIFVLLLMVGILGMVSSFSTIIGTFSIYDLEEKSPNNLVTLSVWVIDADSGRALDNVNVSLSSASGNFSGRSNDQGLVVIEDIVTGEMDLTIYKDGYKTVKSGITIRKGSPNVIDVPMEKGSEEDELPILVHQFKTKTYSGFITNVAASLMFLASIMALISAFFVYKKEFFSLALLSAFLSVFSFGFLVGSIIGFIAVILMIFSYDGFSHTHTLLEMIDKLRRENLPEMLRPGERKLPGLPPVRKRD